MTTPPKSRLQAVLPFLLGILATLMVLWLLGSERLLRLATEPFTGASSEAEAEPGSDDARARSEPARDGHTAEPERHYRDSARPQRAGLAAALAPDSGASLDEVAAPVLPDGGHAALVVAEAGAAVAPAATVALFPLEPVEGGLKSLRFATIAPRVVEHDLATSHSRGYVMVPTAIEVTYGGALGDEVEEIRKLKSGELHGALLSTFGLAQVLPESLLFSTPGLVRTHDEWLAAVRAVGPAMADKLHAQGLELLTWMDLGDAYFFSSAPGITPAGMPAPLFDPGTAAGVTDALLASKLKPQRSSSATLAVDLESGRLRSVVAPPWFVEGAGLLPSVPYVTHTPWMRMTGAVVVTRSALRSLGSYAVRPLRARVEDWASWTYTDWNSWNGDAPLRRLSQKQQVTMVELSGTQLVEWTETEQQTWPFVQNELAASPAQFDAARAAVEAVRAKAAQAQR